MTYWIYGDYWQIYVLRKSQKEYFYLLDSQEFDNPLHCFLDLVEIFACLQEGLQYCRTQATLKSLSLPKKSHLQKIVQAATSKNKHTFIYACYRYICASLVVADHSLPK